VVFGADPLPSLPTIARAVWSGHFLKLRYRRAGKTEVRPCRLGPLALVLKGGIWYLVAQSGKSVRTYRAANIHDAEIAEEIFARPKEFDLAAYWQKASRDYEAGLYREQAVVRLSPKQCGGWNSWVPSCRRPRRPAPASPTAGWLRCTLPIESGEYGLCELMRLGDEAEILGPPAVRAQMASMLAHGAADIGRGVFDGLLFCGWPTLFGELNGPFPSGRDSRQAALAEIASRFIRARFVGTESGGGFPKGRESDSRCWLEGGQHGWSGLF